MAGNKFRNIKVVVGGLKFDSKLEARKWQELCLLEKAGEVSNLQRQVKFDLSVNDLKICTYIADFVFTTREGVCVVYDSKGFRTPEFKLKAKLFKAIHGFDITLSDGLPATARRPKAGKAPARRRPRPASPGR